MIGGRDSFGGICVYLEGGDAMDLGKIGTRVNGLLFEAGGADYCSLQVGVPPAQSLGSLFVPFYFCEELRHLSISLPLGEHGMLQRAGSAVVCNKSFYVSLKRVERGLDDKDNANYRVLCGWRRLVPKF